MNNDKIIKTILCMKRYKDDVTAEPDVCDLIDYNCWLVARKIIPIKEFGKY